MACDLAVDEEVVGFKMDVKGGEESHLENSSSGSVHSGNRGGSRPDSCSGRRLRPRTAPIPNPPSDSLLKQRAGYSFQK